MDYYQVIERAINFIEAHLVLDISPHLVSKAAFYSTPHLYRVFRHMTGWSIKEYMRKRRLSQAAESLMHGERKVIDLALDLHYESPEAFSRAFRREHGLSPLHFREQVQEFTLFQALELSKFTPKEGPEPQYISRRQTAVSGPWLRSSMADGRNERDIPAFWQGNAVQEVLASYGNDAVYGVYTDWFGEDVFSLVVGSPQLSATVLPAHSALAIQSFKTCTIPAQHYACFAVPQGNPEALLETWQYIYGSWFPRSQKDRPRGLVDFERYSATGIEICIPMLD